MLISDDVLFLHVPKTGGLSVTSYLIENLKGPISLSRGLKARPRKTADWPYADIAARLSEFRGGRHESLRRAAKVLAGQGRQLSDFKLILAVIRNPYDLEVSHYEHQRKPKVVKRRGDRTEAVAAAATGDFTHFAKVAPYYGKLPARIERYYTLKGETPANMQLVRFEALSDSVPGLVAPFSFNRGAFPHHNVSSGRRPYRDYLTPEAEAAIYEKYRFLFDFYPRETV